MGKCAPMEAQCHSHETVAPYLASINGFPRTPEPHLFLLPVALIHILERVSVQITSAHYLRYYQPKNEPKLHGAQKTSDAGRCKTPNCALHKIRPTQAGEKHQVSSYTNSAQRRHTQKIRGAQHAPDANPRKSTLAGCATHTQRKRQLVCCGWGGVP